MYLPGTLFRAIVSIGDYLGCVSTWFLRAFGGLSLACECRQGAVRNLQPLAVGQLYGCFGCICLDRNTVVRVRYQVILGQAAEVLAIVLAELRVALISDSEACLTDID